MKIKLTVVAVLLILSSMLIPTVFWQHPESKGLKLFFITANHVPSLNPDDSDVLYNTALMEQLVGTLVKETQGNTGRSEPYLAESWHSDPEQLNWEFKLRAGLSDESNQPINAKTFLSSFTKRLRTLSLDHDVPAFNQLRGWQDFTSHRSEQITGLVAKDDIFLEMHFQAKPLGLLEYLAMPAFGFYGENNYSDGKNWKSNTFLVASGGYKIGRFIDATTITLARRANWPLNPPESLSEATYYFAPFQKIASLIDVYSIACFRHREEDSAAVRLMGTIRGSPIFLNALVLANSKKGFFQSEDNRHAFLKIFRNEWLANGINDNSNTTSSSSFYKFSPYSKELEAKIDSYPDTFEVSHGMSELTFGYDPVYLDSPIFQVYHFLEKMFSKQNIKLRQVPIDKKDPEWLSKLRSNLFYDIRLASVDIGGNPENWVIKMMFCSKLGISFPDPSGGMCKFVSRIETESETSMENYVSEFNALLVKDGAVIPFSHSGYIWKFGSKIKAGAMNGTTVVPRLDQLNVE